MGGGGGSIGKQPHLDASDSLTVTLNLPRFTTGDTQCEVTHMQMTNCLRGPSTAALLSLAPPPHDPKPASPSKRKTPHAPSRVLQLGGSSACPNLRDSRRNV